MQFGRKMFTNEGAYAVLKSPNFESPSFHSFKAVERPKVWNPTFEEHMVSKTLFLSCMGKKETTKKKEKKKSEKEL